MALTTPPPVAVTLVMMVVGFDGGWTAVMLGYNFGVPDTKGDKLEIYPKRVRGKG